MDEEEKGSNANDIWRDAVTAGRSHGAAGWYSSSRRSLYRKQEKKQDQNSVQWCASLASVPLDLMISLKYFIVSYLIVTDFVRCYQDHNIFHLQIWYFTSITKSHSSKCYEILSRIGYLKVANSMGYLTKITIYHVVDIMVYFIRIPMFDSYRFFEIFHHNHNISCCPLVLSSGCPVIPLSSCPVVPLSPLSPIPVL